MNKILNYLFFLLFFCYGISVSAQDRDLQLAQQYYIQGDFEKAVVYYEKVFQKDPGHANFIRYYECLIQTNNTKEAEKLIKKQIDKNPNNVDYTFRYADFLEKNDRSKEATKIYQNLISKKAINTLTVKDLYNSFKDLNRLNYAKQTLDAGRKAFGTNFPLNTEYAELYYLEGNYSKMMEEYINYIDIFPNRLSDIQQILSDLIEQNDDNTPFQDAVKNKLLEKTQKNSNDYLYSEFLIWYFAQRKQFNVALTQVQALDKRENGQGKRVYELGMICLQNKDYRIASKAFKYITGLSDSYLLKDAERALLKVRFLEITENKEFDSSIIQEVIKEYEMVISSGGNNRTNYQLLTELATIHAYYADNHQKSIAILTDLIKTAGLTAMQIAEAKVLLADIYVLTNEIWEASLLYMQVDGEFKYEPIGFEAKYKNARIFYYTGDFKFAQSQLDVLKQSTTKLIANDAMKLSILITDNFGLDSNYHAMSLFAHADLLLEQHLYEKAFSLYDSIITLYPYHGLADEVALRKATAMMNQGKWDNAVSYLQEIIKYHSEDILIDDALFYLGKIYEEQKNDPEKAMEYYKKILFEHPSSLYTAEVRQRIRKLRGES